MFLVLLMTKQNKLFVYYTTEKKLGQLEPDSELLKQRVGVCSLLEFNPSVSSRGPRSVVLTLNVVQ